MVGKDSGIFPGELAPIVHVPDVDALFTATLHSGAQADIESGKFRPFRRLLGRVWERMGCVALQNLYGNEYPITTPDVSDKMHSQYQRLHQPPSEEEFGGVAFPDAFVLEGIGDGVCRLLSMVECKIPPKRSFIDGDQDVQEYFLRLNRQLYCFDVLRSKLREMPELQQVLLSSISTPKRQFTELDIPQGKDMSILYVVPWDRRLDEMVDLWELRVCQMVLTVTDDQIRELINARLGYQVGGHHAVEGKNG